MIKTLRCTCCFMRVNTQRERNSGTKRGDACSRWNSTLEVEQAIMLLTRNDPRSHQTSSDSTARLRGFAPLDRPSRRHVARTRRHRGKQLRLQKPLKLGLQCRGWLLARVPVLLRAQRGDD